ncbi:MAG: hypothetical protein CR972_05035 [Candidatus Moraniibacteriota bacterium]|nr:MAG: hypothetical protein CR972_05035 [Candidatus Moranbacteria bacterium]
MNRNKNVCNIRFGFILGILSALILLILVFFPPYYYFVVFLHYLTDPCYEKREIAKGGYPYEIRDDRVCIQHGYADSSLLFARMKTLKGADPKTFEKIDYNHFKDKNHVYYKSSQISSDPENFEHLGGIYYKDTSHIYTYHFAIDVDIATFEVLEGNFFAKEKNRVYYNYNETIDADMESFQALRGHYAKDKNYVYYTNVGSSGRSIIIDGADPETFVTFDAPEDEWKAKNKNGYYEFGKMVQSFE